MFQAATYPPYEPLPDGRSLVRIPEEGDGPSHLSRLQKQRKRWLVLLGAFMVPQSGMIEPVWRESGGLLQLDQLGAILLAAAILGRCWCTLYIAAHKKEKLVTTGPYSLCRNPLYLFNCAGAAAIGLLSNSISVAVLFCVAVCVLFHGVARQEETHLAQRFAAAYRRYCNTTPRWIPAFGRWRDDSRLVTRPGLLLITLRDGACLFAFWPFFWMSAIARETGILPTLLVLP